MLLRLAPLPRGEAWSFEPKWDGFRALAVLDGELVGVAGRQPSFEVLQADMRLGETASVAFLAFDLL